MEKIQNHLGDRVGKDVNLISITVDPVNDTPAKLKEYGARFHAKPGWYLLTGSKENVQAALSKLGQWVDVLADDSGAPYPSPGFASGNVSVFFNPIPEPTTLAAALVPAGLLALRRRQRG